MTFWERENYINTVKRSMTTGVIWEGQAEHRGYLGRQILLECILPSPDQPLTKNMIKRGLNIYYF